MGFFPALPENVEIAIVIMVLIYTTISIFVQRKLGNPKRMREIQAKVQVAQKEMNEMIKRNAPQQEIFAKQKEVMPLMGESMKNSLKPALIILPLIPIIYYLIIPNISIFSANVAGAKTLFFYLVVILGIVAAIIIFNYDRKLIKKEMELLQNEKKIEKEISEMPKAQNPANNQ